MADRDQLVENGGITVNCFAISPYLPRTTCVWYRPSRSQNFHKVVHRFNPLLDDQILHTHQLVDTVEDKYKWDLI